MPKKGDQSILEQIAEGGAVRMIQSEQLPFSVKKYTAGVIRNDFIQILSVTGEFPGNGLIGLSLPHLYSRLMDQMLNA